MSEYCGIFAEKTNRIGKNVEYFMQSRGFLPPVQRQSFYETTRYPNNVLPSSKINGDIKKGVYGKTRILEQDRYYDGITSVGNNDRMETLVSRESHPNDRVRCTSEMQLARRPKRRNYREQYDDRSDGWKDPSRNVNGAKPILRNGIGYQRAERPYCSTLPRRSRTINFKDQPYNSLEELRGYPKSLQDLTDFEVEERIGNSTVSSYPKTRTRSRDDRPADVYRQRRLRDAPVDSLPEDDYLKFCRNLARMERYPRGGRYEPGQVHYERECRTFGKDTVAFIYYKTCYL